jgi:hypothetical protein
MKRHASGTPISLVLRVPYVGKLPNALLHRHWTVVSANRRAAYRAFVRSVLSLSEEEKRTMMAIAEHLNGSGMPLRPSSELMTETNDSVGDIPAS